MLRLQYHVPAYNFNKLLHKQATLEPIGAGVLIRALEPLKGIPIMQLNRGIERLRDLARGPGRLTAALRVDRSLDGLDLCREGPLWLGRGDHESDEIGQSIRIGISRREPPPTILSSGQSVRRRSKIAQRVRARHSRPPPLLKGSQDSKPRFLRSRSRLHCVNSAVAYEELRPKVGGGMKG